MALYLCPTPLGNLEDVTLRVLNVLRTVQKIAAEDTRHTRKLLSHYDIHTPLTSYHEHNKHKKTATILAWLDAGQNVALVSDAGTPGIADPGEELVREAIHHQIPVIALPGPVAAVTALTASGMPSATFAFYGFVPARGSARKTTLSQLLSESKTVVFYEAPHRLIKTLDELWNVDPKRQIVVARELTKIHEEYIRGSLDMVRAHFQEHEPRGEMTVILAAKEVEAVRSLDAVAVAEQLIGAGYRKNDAIKEAAVRTGVGRNEIYKEMLKKK